MSKAHLAVTDMYDRLIIYYDCRVCSCLNKTDAISVLDGSSIKSPAISLICNTAADYEVSLTHDGLHALIQPSVCVMQILSTGPDLTVEFISNSDEPGLGFKAKFHFVKIQLDNTIGNIRMHQNFQQYGN